MMRVILIDSTKSMGCFFVEKMLPALGTKIATGFIPDTTSEE